MIFIAKGVVGSVYYIIMLFNFVCSIENGLGMVKSLQNDSFHGFVSIKKQQKTKLINPQRGKDPSMGDGTTLSLFLLPTLFIFRFVSVLSRTPSIWVEKKRNRVMGFLSFLAYRSRAY